jgi:hypothetical protein
MFGSSDLNAYEASLHVISLAATGSRMPHAKQELVFQLLKETGVMELINRCKGELERQNKTAVSDAEIAQFFYAFNELLDRLSTRDTLEEPAPMPLLAIETVGKEELIQLEEFFANASLFYDPLGGSYHWRMRTYMSWASRLVSCVRNVLIVSANLSDIQTPEVLFAYLAEPHFKDYVNLASRIRSSLDRNDLTPDELVAQYFRFRAIDEELRVIGMGQDVI